MESQIHVNEDEILHMQAVMSTLAYCDSIAAVTEV